MDAYADFTRMNSVDETDPVTLEEVEYDENAHPRSVMTIRRANGRPYSYYVNTVLDIIDRGNGRDPITRENFSTNTIRRARLYKCCMVEFPNYKLKDLDVKDLYKRWWISYDDALMSEKLKSRVRLEARCFLQAPDLKGMFESFSGAGSMDSRRTAEAVLNSENRWLIRDCSVQSTETSKAYALSSWCDGVCSHSLIVHRLGDGFYFRPSGIGRGDSADLPITGYADKFPTIIDLLNDVVFCYAKPRF